MAAVDRGNLPGDDDLDVDGNSPPNRIRVPAGTGLGLRSRVGSYCGARCQRRSEIVPPERDMPSTTGLEAKSTTRDPVATTEGQIVGSARSFLRRACALGNLY